MKSPTLAQRVVLIMTAVLFAAAVLLPPIQEIGDAAPGARFGFLFALADTQVIRYKAWLMVIATTLGIGSFGYIAGMREDYTPTDV